MQLAADFEPLQAFRGCCRSAAPDSGLGPPAFTLPGANGGALGGAGSWATRELVRCGVALGAAYDLCGERTCMALHSRFLHLRPDIPPLVQPLLTELPPSPGWKAPTTSTSPGNAVSLNRVYRKPQPHPPLRREAFQGHHASCTPVPKND